MDLGGFDINVSGQFRINNLTITYESNNDSKPEEPGDEVEATTEYIFNSNSWGTSQDDWTSGKDGNKYESERGIQVTSGASGANGTTKITFYNVKSFEIYILLSVCF